MHGMGKVTKVGDSFALADALLDIFAEKPRFLCDTEELKHLYDPDTVAGEYEILFRKLMLKN
jgi:hypothetical protein